MWIRAILTAILLAVAAPAPAEGPDRFSVLLGSRHVGATQDFEEVNPGLFLTWEEAFEVGPLDIDASLGAFRNSYGRLSVAAVGAWRFYERGPFELGLFLGAAYYPEDGRSFQVHVGDVVPLGGLQARLGPVFLQAIPSDGAVADAIFAAGVTVPLGAGQD